MSLSGRATGRAILSEDAIVDAAAHRRRARLAHKQSRQEIFEKLHALREEGLSYSEIARRTGYERRSVAKWLKFEAPPDRRRAALKPTSPWYFETFLAQRTQSQMTYLTVSKEKSPQSPPPKCPESHGLVCFKQAEWVAQMTSFPYLKEWRDCSVISKARSAHFVPREMFGSMRILPFPLRRTNKAETSASDWSQEEIADFYRAHRLMVENGAGIGIDRGVSDIGEPWMVFYDGVSQDVFLHVARIDNRCHLICFSLDLRLSAANISQLITEFENSVRELLSIRAERSKNVIIHPAARIIMSISAIFLLFKLETGDAQAKALHEKSDSGPEAGSGRWNDKASPTIVRAQTAFSRVFESTDTPGHVALLAGAVIALELSRSTVQSANSSSSETKADGFVTQAKADAHFFEAHTDIVIKPEELSSPGKYADKVQQTVPSEFVVAQTDFTPDETVNNTPSKPLKLSDVDHTLIASSKTEQDPIVNKDMGDPVKAEQTSLEGMSAVPAKASTGALGNEAAKVLQEFISFANADDAHSILKYLSIGKSEIENDVGDITASNLDDIGDKVGFFVRTQLDDAQLYKLLQYLASNMQEYDYDYVTGKVLIEGKDVETLADNDIGLWTNVMVDGSTFSVVGHAGLIDDVVTFFA